MYLALAALAFMFTLRGVLAVFLILYALALLLRFTIFLAKKAGLHGRPLMKVYRVQKYLTMRFALFVTFMIYGSILLAQAINWFVNFVD
jgi:hypothetical protein